MKKIFIRNGKKMAETINCEQEDCNLRNSA